MELTEELWARILDALADAIPVIAQRSVRIQVEELLAELECYELQPKDWKNSLRG